MVMRLNLNKLVAKVHHWMRENRALLLVLLTGLVLRLLFITLFSHWDEGAMMDSSRYRRVALNIIAGRGFAEWRFPSAFSPPLYPYFMAAVIRLFGESAIPVKVIQVLFSTLTCYFVYRIGKELFNRRIGLIAALGTALNPEIIVLAGSLYTETLYIFISCLVFAVLAVAVRHPEKKRIWLYTGILMALAILTRHILILFPVYLLMFAAVFPSLRHLVKPTASAAMICYLLLVPWTVRNYVVFDHFVPVASGAGGGLWHGSYLSHDGRFQYGKSRDVIARETRGLESPVDKDRALLGKSLKTIAHEPFQFAGMTARKFIRFFTQVYEDVPQGHERRSNWRVQLALMLAYYPLLVGCILGIAFSAGRWRNLYILYGVIVYSGLVYSVTLVTPRYRIPLLPFLILFTSVAVSTGIDHWISRKRNRTRSNPEAQA